MKEQDFLAERPRRRDNGLLVSTRLRGAAAAAASAAGAAALAFVLAVLPPIEARNGAATMQQPTVIPLA